MAKNQFMTQLDADLLGNHLNLNEFGEEVIYTPKSTGVPLTLQALFDEPDVAVQPDTEVAIISKQPQITIREIDLPGERPKKGDQVSVRGKLYKVVDDLSDKLGIIEVLLHEVRV
jgi:hypothetical protein